MSSATVRPELTGDYDIDVEHSHIGFVARHAMVTKVRGAFTKFEGVLHIDGSEPTRSSGEIAVDATSIDTGSQQRDEHLRSNDFFDMSQYPQITFRSTSVLARGDDKYTVTGDLTVKGATRSIDIDVEYTGSAVDPFGNTRIGLEASGSLSRKDWGITWNAPLETGGVLIGDRVSLEIDISAVKRTPGA